MTLPSTSNYYRKTFSGFSKEDEDQNVAAIVKANASFCHPSIRYYPQVAMETPIGIDLFKYVCSKRPFSDKLKAIAAAFDCLSLLHDTYQCYHLDAKASNFVVYDCNKVYLIDFETMFRRSTSPLPGRQDRKKFDHMSDGLWRFGFKPYLHYEIFVDIAYRYDVFSLASSIFEYAQNFLPETLLDLLFDVIAGSHSEEICEILPNGKRVVHRTYLRDASQPILNAALAASLVRSFKLRPLKRTHSV